MIKMEVFVLLVLIIIIIGWLSVKSKDKAKQKMHRSSNKFESIIKISDRKENNDGLSVDLLVDVFYKLRCQFHRNGGSVKHIV